MADNRLIPDVVRGIRTNSRVEIRNPQSTRPWQHVLDPLLGYLMTLEFQLSGGYLDALNFGPTEESLSVASVIHVIEKEWPDCVEFDYPEKEVSVNTLESKTLDLDSQKAVRTLGWVPTWSQESAIRSTINWWKDVLFEKVSESEACIRDIHAIKTL